jgi:hypothetical protein
VEQPEWVIEGRRMTRTSDLGGPAAAGATGPEVGQSRRRVASPRSHAATRWLLRQAMVKAGLFVVAFALAVPGVAEALATPAVAKAQAVTRRPEVPLLAYYYLWFDPSSWNRAKTDYPQLGRYSSDDPRVMRQQIEWAKSAGIDGFVVSWKDTPANNRRLRRLMAVAKELNFKLAMIYQGLDFERRPQPVARVAADFVTFRDTFAPDPVYLRLGGKPLTIWSGTWEFSPADVATVTSRVRGSMLVLATEKSVEGYQRIAGATDGNAYYWSSVNPDTNSNYTAKLNAMSAAVHHDGKYWMAPFAPGFDARLVGGTREVDRKDGETLRRQYAAAVSSSPDVLGLISWNEFSENSYVEPSLKYGTRYLDVLRDLTSTPVPNPPQAADASEAAAGFGNAWPSPLWSNLLLLVGFPTALVVGVGAIAVLRRRRRRRPTTPWEGRSP